MWRRLASFSRLILFDQHGTGLSGWMPPGPLPPLEAWLDDIDLVLDAVGSSRAGLFGFGSGGPLAMMFAARHPERTRSLVLLNTYARLARADDYPHGVPSSLQAASSDWVEQYWGTGEMLDIVSPGVAADERTRRWWARHERLSANPGAAAEFWRMTFDVDVRPVLDEIRVPTLVLHNEGDRGIRVGHGRYLAERIPGTRYIEFPGGDHFTLQDSPSTIEEIEEFLTGIRGAHAARREFMAVLFTDIVDSTARATQLGDRRWRNLLDDHDGILRDTLVRFDGHEIKATGDGIMATFRRPAYAIRCACAMRDALRGIDLQVRAGIHAGEVDLRDDDVGGIAVHIASRVADLARPEEVLVSSTVKDLVTGSGFTFAERGDHQLKGVPDSWRLFRVESDSSTGNPSA
jgi:class 3 adenylate cyclase